MANKATIAFQGVEGAFSHLACRGCYPDMTPLPCHFFDDALEAVETGRADYSMIPIENSIGGRVAEIHHLLLNTKLSIIGEYFQPVEHQLLVQKGTRLEQINQVLSHPQALAQCRNFIRELKLDALDCVDTAHAAREIANGKDKSMAAIASSLAAEIYGLEIIRKNVEDRSDNTTRFIIMAREQKPFSHEELSSCITALCFRLRSIPAALYKALGGFATNGINLLKLESYISPADFQAAEFYIELAGHPDMQSIGYALDELKLFSEEYRIIGIFPQSSWRVKKADKPG